MKKSIMKLSIASIGILECINRYIDSAVEKMETKKGLKKYNWEHGEIAYTISGNGEPILLIHDLNVFSSGQDWTGISKKLSQNYKVYTIDLPGCGKSDKPTLTYTNYLYVQMTTDFIKNIIGERTTIVASGLSSTFPLMADSLHSDLIKDIIMINPPSLSSLKRLPDRRSKVLTTLFGLPVIGKSCYYIATNRTNTEYYLTEKCFFNPFHMKQYHVKAAYQAAHDQKGNGRYLFASLEGQYLNVDISKVLENRTEKTVLIVSEQEKDAKEISTSYQKLNKNIIVKTIKGAKKLPELEIPEEIYRILLKELLKENRYTEEEPQTHTA